MKLRTASLFIGFLLLVPLVYSSFASEEEAQGHITEAEEHHNLAVQSENAGNFVEAAVHHHQAGIHYHEAAMVYEQDGDHENAAKYHHEAGKHHHMAAEQLELAGRYAEAAQHHKESAEHHVMAAEQLESIGNFEEAIKHYQEAAKHYKMAVTQSGIGSQDKLHVTQYLAWKSIPAKGYMLLFDSTPDTIAGGHFAIKANCDEEGNGAVDVLMGMAPNMETVKLSHKDNMIHELSTHGEMCLYHIDLPAEHDMKVTDIAIYNPSDERIRFGMTATATIYVNAWGEPVEHEGHEEHGDMNHME